LLCVLLVCCLCAAWVLAVALGLKNTSLLEGPCVCGCGCDCIVGMSVKLLWKKKNWLLKKKKKKKKKQGRRGRWRRRQKIKKKKSSKKREKSCYLPITILLFFCTL
jgi:hypothetical protein